MPTQTEIIDALHFEMTGLADPAVNTTSNAAWTFTFQFESTDPADLPTSTEYTGWTALSEAEQANVRLLMDHIESIVNVLFIEVTSNADPDLNIGKVDLPDFSGYGGYSYSYNGQGELVRYDGYALFGNTLDLTTQDNLILHELGHAMAIKHPFSGPDTLSGEFDNNKYTVMSYDPNADNGLDSDALQLFDILALQARWGANDTTNPTADHYTGPRNGTVDAIWDSGGTDWLDAKAMITSVSLSLIEGTFSSFESTDDVVITYNVVIEHASGGKDDDSVVGNDIRNKLYGRDGHDMLWGGSGDDDLVGGRGNDTMHGGDDADLLKGGNGRDIMNGNAGDDTLRGGNGKDTLDGGTGTDSLFGNKGVDTFLFVSGYGTDTVMDFEDDKDRILFDIEGLTTRSLIRKVAVQDGDDVVYDFGEGDILRVINITVAAMENDINTFDSLAIA
jgi:serralysin